MSLDPDAVTWITPKVHDVIAAAMDFHGAGVADAVCAVGVRYGDDGVYALCCGLAEAIAVLGGFERTADMRHGFTLLSNATGQQIGPADVAPTAVAEVMGLQFLMAHLNGELDQTQALFAAQPVKVSAGLAKLAGTYGRGRRVDG